MKKPSISAFSIEVACLDGASQSATAMRTYITGANISDKTRLKELAAAGQLGHQPVSSHQPLRQICLS